jgi:hypothetical protein
MSFLPFKINGNISLYAEKHNLDQYNFYFQDEWKVRPNLTINYGARWEYNPPSNTSPNDNVFVASTSDRRHAFAGDPGSESARAPCHSSKRSIGMKAASPARLAHASVWRGVLLSNQAFSRASSAKITERDSHRLWNRLRHDLIVPGDGRCRTRSRSGPKLHDFLLDDDFVVLVDYQGACCRRPSTTRSPAVSRLSCRRRREAFVTVHAAAATESEFAADHVFDPHMNLPTVHEWNFSFQRELPWGW